MVDKNPIRGLPSFVQLDGRPHAPHLDVQVSDLVEQRQFVIELRRTLELVKDPGI